MCKNALYLQNECAKDSHPPTEPAADCKELFMGVEKPPDKGGRISGIDSLISMSVKGRGNAFISSADGGCSKAYFGVRFAH